MNSTLMRTVAPSAAWSGATLVDALLLPAATGAPAALVVAVDARVSQETSVLGQDVVAGGQGDRSAAAYAAPAVVVPAAFRTRTHVTGPPSRGTPV